MQLKREVAGTSRIEGADFTEGELEVALRQDATPEELKTRSQRQAHSAVTTYRWIASLQDDHPIDACLIKEVHWRIVTNCDDDHCAQALFVGLTATSHSAYGSIVAVTAGKCASKHSMI